jgi:FkbM family methyltransferase
MAYTPSPFRISKYGKYLSYYLEFMKRGDFQSASAAFQFVLFKKLPAKDRVATTRMGTFQFRKGTTDFQFANFSYEIAIKKHLMQVVGEMGLFIDIGACIGEYDIWLAKQGVRAIAIEPVNHRAIFENIALNKVADKIQVVNCAVGSENKKVSFNVLEHVTGSSSLNKEESGGNIDCRRLDDIIDISAIDQDKLTVIKLDIEGYEIEALKGAERLIKGVNKLHLIYEYTFSGEQAIRKVLDSYATFKYTDLDGVNMLAEKC